MKNKSIKYIVGALAFIFVVTSCSNNEDAIATLQPANQGILTFSSEQEFQSTLEKVSSMKPEQRLEWEKSKGFKSFGAICDEIYKGIDPTKFKSLQQVKDTVAKLSAYLEIGQNDEGKSYVDPKESANPMRYLINKDKMYIIKDSVYKQFDNGSVVMNVSKIEELKQLKSIENVQSDKSLNVIRKVVNEVDVSSFERWSEKRKYVNLIQGNQTYALRVRLSTYKSDDGNKSYLYTNCTYNNYKWTLFTFWADERSQTSLYVEIWTYNDVSMFGQWLDWSRNNYSSGESYTKIMENDAAHPNADNYVGHFGKPYFTHYIVSASNWAGCTISETYNR